MATIRLAFLFCSTLLVISSAILALDADEPNLEKQIEKILAEKNAIAVSKGYRVLFQQIGTDGILRLKDHKNPGVALRAGWEEVRLAVPETEPNPARAVDAKALDRFLDFAKKRLPASIPRWWQMVLLGAEAHRRDNIYFRLTAACPRDEVGAGFLGNPGVGVTRRNQELLITVGDDSVVIAKTAADKVSRELVAVAIAKTHGYVAFYHSFAFGYPLHCVDRDSGKLAWKADVWADGGFVIYSGLGHDHAVTIVPREKQVTVFGAGAHRLYVEAFDTATGTLLYRFCTGY